MVLLRESNLVSIVQLKHLSDHAHLSMIAVIPHAMAPHHLALLEQELASDLEDVATLDNIPLTDRQFVLAERARSDRRR